MTKPTRFMYLVSSDFFLIVCAFVLGAIMGIVFWDPVVFAVSTILFMMMTLLTMISMRVYLVIQKYEDAQMPQVWEGDGG